MYLVSQGEIKVTRKAIPTYLVSFFSIGRSDHLHMLLASFTLFTSYQQSRKNYRHDQTAYLAVIDGV